MTVDPRLRLMRASAMVHVQLKEKNESFSDRSRERMIIEMFSVAEDCDVCMSDMYISALRRKIFVCISPVDHVAGSCSCQEGKLH